MEVQRWRLATRQELDLVQVLIQTLLNSEQNLGLGGGVKGS
jgi:hypothetical protein